jgi:E3 ubiquitin-protein ligase MUL1
MIFCHLLVQWWVQTLALCLGGVGAFLVLRKATKQALRRWREHKARERVRRAVLQQQLAQRDVEAGAGGGVVADMWDADAESASRAIGAAGAAGVCVVCLNAASDMVYVRCGHMCCCSKCVATMGGSKRCPVCRTEGNVIKVFRT